MKCFCVAFEMNNFHCADFLIMRMRDVTSPNALRGSRSVTTYALACSESSFYGTFAVEEDVLLLLPS